MEQQIEMEFRKANEDDNLEEIAELLYLTDQYIYPYWFGSLENLPYFNTSIHQSYDYFKESSCCKLVIFVVLLTMY